MNKHCFFTQNKTAIRFVGYLSAGTALAIILVNTIKRGMCGITVGAAFFFIIGLLFLLAAKNCKLQITKTSVIRTNLFGIKKHYYFQELKACYYNADWFHYVFSNGSLKLRIEQTIQDEIRILPELIQQACKENPNILFAYKKSRWEHSAISNFPEFVVAFVLLGITVVSTLVFCILLAHFHTPDLNPIQIVFSASQLDEDKLVLYDGQTQYQLQGITEKETDIDSILDAVHQKETLSILFDAKQMIFSEANQFQVYMIYDKNQDPLLSQARVDEWNQNERNKDRLVVGILLVLMMVYLILVILFAIMVRNPKKHRRLYHFFTARSHRLPE